MSLISTNQTIYKFQLGLGLWLGLWFRDQMIRAMYDLCRLIGRFAQDDSRKNGDDS